jgi:hypothetical protein
VAITITATDGTAIAMRLTDRSGKILPIPVPTPELSESQTPENSQLPFTAVNLFARKQGYEQIEVENLQVFAETVTLQDLMMVPLSELPDSWKKKEIYVTTKQNL